MRELPRGWVEARLDELVSPEPAAITDGPFGSNLKTEHYTNAGPRVIRLQNIGDGVFRDERAHIGAERFESLKKHEARAGDVVIAALGEVLPRACVVPEYVGPAIVKADCIRARLHHELNPHFVTAMLNSPSVRRAASAEISGVGRPRLNLAKVRSIRLPIPPRPEQERIVAAIEEQSSRLDAAQDSLQSTQRRLVQLRSAVLTASAAGPWPLIALGSVLTYLKNGVFVSRPTAAPPGIPIYRISAVRPMTLDLGDIRFADIEEERAAPFFTRPGDLLFTRYSGNPRYVGSCAVVPPGAPPVLHPDKLIRGVVDPDVALPEFIALATNVGHGRNEIEKRLKTTAGQVGIAGSQLKSVTIPLPPIDVQRSTVERVDAALTAERALAEALHRVGRRSTLLRSAILGRAFSGRLVPQDRRDEPASELMGRIAADRGDASKSRPRRRA